MCHYLVSLNIFVFWWSLRIGVSNDCVVLLCCCIVVLLYCCIVVLLCYCAIVLLCCCVIVLLCCCIVVLLCYCVVVLLYCCVIVLLCHYVVVLLCCCACCCVLCVICLFHWQLHYRPKNVRWSQTACSQWVLKMATSSSNKVTWVISFIWLKRWVCFHQCKCACCLFCFYVIYCCWY